PDRVHLAGGDVAAGRPDLHRHAARGGRGAQAAGVAEGGGRGGGGDRGAGGVAECGGAGVKWKRPDRRPLSPAGPGISQCFSRRRLPPGGGVPVPPALPLPPRGVTPPPFPLPLPLGRFSGGGSIRPPLPGSGSGMAAPAGKALSGIWLIRPFLSLSASF